MAEVGTETALETRKLTRLYGGLVAIDNLDFRVRRGELRCLIGPNGAGKTTLFNLVTAKVHPSRGQVFFNGEDITRLSQRDICQRGIGRKFQVPSVFTDLTVVDNLRVARRGKNKLASLLRSAYDESVEEDVEKILADVRLSDKRDARAGSLSHGEKQWLEIGMVLVNKPELLLLDEPTAGMTVEETHETAKLIKSISAGLTTIIIEHDINFVREMADIITVLHRGALLAEGPLEEIAKNEMVRNVYLGKQEL
jgi:urea transport system ATP-binding protein